MENKTGKVVGAKATEPNSEGTELQLVSKDSCKYCYGRGYERWLSGRIKHPDGSIEEQFENCQCRCVKMKVTSPSG